MKIILNTQDPRWNKFDFDMDKIISAINIKKNKNAEISVILTNDSEIQKLNKQYRGFDKPTNVLSFETGDDVLLGDIYISFDTVMAEAEADGKKFENHTIHMIVHGVLHLCGYDHIKGVDAKKMESTEIKILKKLNIKSPYDKNNLLNNKWAIAILYLLAGGISSLGFAPYHMWPLTLIGLGLAYYLTVFDGGRDSFLKSVLRVMPFGFMYAVCMFWWMLNSIYVIPELAAEFAVWTAPSLLGIGLFGGFIFTIPFAIIRSLRRILPYRAVLFAGSWMSVLWFREWLLTGFPWNPVANITMPIPVLSNSMSVFGAIGLTFILIGLIASVSEFIINRKNKSAVISMSVFTVLLIISGLFGYKNINTVKNLENKNDIKVRIVQPSFSAEDKASHSPHQMQLNNELNIQRLISMVKSDNEKFDLIVFPETTYPGIITDSYMPLAEILGTKIITGATTYKNGELYNSLVVANEMGEIEKIYNKSHLVPFGEYRPFGDIIPTPGQLTSGAGPEIINTDLNNFNFSFAPAVCYEIVFSSSLVPSSDIDKPQTIINITNDIWFGNTQGSYQHLDMVKRYAIESGLSVVRANYSGISAFISADGSIIKSLPIGVSGILDGTIPPSHITVYRKIGLDLMFVIFLLFSALLSFGLYKYRK